MDFLLETQKKTGVVKNSIPAVLIQYKESWDQVVTQDFPIMPLELGPSRNWLFWTEAQSKDTFMHSPGCWNTLSKTCVVELIDGPASISNIRDWCPGGVDVPIWLYSGYVNSNVCFCCRELVPTEAICSKGRIVPRSSGMWHSERNGSSAIHATFYCSIFPGRQRMVLCSLRTLQIAQPCGIPVSRICCEWSTTEISQDKFSNDSKFLGDIQSRLSCIDTILHWYFCQRLSSKFRVLERVLKHVLLSRVDGNVTQSWRLHQGNWHWLLQVFMQDE